MLGHTFFNSWKDNHEVKVTLKGRSDQYAPYKIFNESNSFFSLNVVDLDAFEKCIQTFMPDCVVNCIGITKRLCTSDNTVDAISINAMFPHKLEEFCKNLEIKLIQLSTDCIFSGNKGLYSETDSSDAEDLYGKSKFLGELTSSSSLTLRKSTIGLELTNKHGLVEWFLSQRGQILGYSEAIYSGFTSSFLASIVEEIFTNYPDLNGVLNIASEPISKYELLVNLRDRLDNFHIDIIRDDKIKLDRSLSPDKFNKMTNISVPSWEKMLDDLAEDINKRIYDSRK